MTLSKTCAKYMQLFNILMCERKDKSSSSFQIASR